MPQPIGLIIYKYGDGCFEYIEATDIQRIRDKPDGCSLHLRNGEWLHTLTPAAEIAADYDRLVQLARPPHLTEGVIAHGFDNE